MIKIGSTNIQKVFAGSSEVIKVYAGSSLLYQASEDTAEITVNITGLPEDYEVSLSGEVWVDNSKTFPVGTSKRITPSLDGYTFSPPYIDITVTVDDTIDFVATADEVGDENYLAGFSPYLINEGLIDGAKPPIPNSPTAGRWTGDEAFWISDVLTTTGDQIAFKLMAGDHFKNGFGYDDLYETNALDWDGSVLSLDLNGSFSSLSPQPVVGDHIIMEVLGDSGDGFGIKVSKVHNGVPIEITGAGLSSLWGYNVFPAGLIQTGGIFSYPQIKKA